jgi:hypothetical protein
MHTVLIAVLLTSLVLAFAVIGGVAGGIITFFIGVSAGWEEAVITAAMQDAAVTGGLIGGVVTILGICFASHEPETPLE